MLSDSVGEVGWAVFLKYWGSEMQQFRRGLQAMQQSCGREVRYKGESTTPGSITFDSAHGWCSGSTGMWEAEFGTCPSHEKVHLLSNYKIIDHWSEKGQGSSSTTTYYLATE